MNLTAEDLASGVLRDRVKVGASLADVDPMNLDSSVSGIATGYHKAAEQHNFIYLLLLELQYVCSPNRAS